MNKFLNQKSTRPTFWDDFFARNWYMDDTTGNIMLTDISKRKGNYVFDVDVPGYAREDIQVKLENGYLVVTAQKSSQTGSDEVKEEYEYLRKERYSGKFSRTFYVGCSDETKVNASYHNGVLTIVIPETCEENTKKGKFIEIN